MKEEQHTHPRRRGRTGQLGKINRIRLRARPRSDFVIHIIGVEQKIAVNKAEARARYGT